MIERVNEEHEAYKNMSTKELFLECHKLGIQDKINEELKAEFLGTLDEDTKAELLSRTKMRNNVEFK